MNRAYTPDLNPDVLDRLAAYAAAFRDHFNRPRQARWCGAYPHGLLRDGDRKGVEPMAARVPLPEGLAVCDPDQARQQFLGQSTRDERAVLGRHRATMAAKFADPAGLFAIDDTTFPGQGPHPVGVQRQYRGAPGKTANCQCAVGVHYVAPTGHYPPDMRLVPPDSWPDDPARLDKAGVPDAGRRRLSEGQSALERLDRARAEGLPGQVAVADAGYGIAGPFRDGLAERGLHYVVGVTDEMVAFAEEPAWDCPGPADRPAGTGGRARTRPRLAGGSPRPMGLKGLAARTPRREVTWREGAKGPMWGRSAWPRVWPAGGWATGACAGAAPIWLRIEEQTDGELKYAFSDLPADTSRLEAVRLWRSRWPVELGYQQMKEELGLAHDGGRSWRGLRHPRCPVMLAFGFLSPERHRARRGRSRPGKEGGAERP